MKKKLIILFLSLFAVVIITSLAGSCMMIPHSGLRRIATVFFNLLNAGVAICAMKLTGMHIDLDLKNKKQYLIGLCLAVALSLFIAVIPALLGVSLAGNHVDFSLGLLIREFLFYMLVIGPVEELVFRVYIQDTVTGFFVRQKWIGVVISAFIFGLWHLINGSLIQVVFTFGIGLVFAFSKHVIKDCKYLGLALGHGLYDFLNLVVRMLIV